MSSANTSDILDSRTCRRDALIVVLTEALFVIPIMLSLALKGLQSTVRAGVRVLDVGCGSGILSIASVRLGASAVTAVDTDPLAVESTRENAALNGTGAATHVQPGSAADVPGRPLTARVHIFVLSRPPRSSSACVAPDSSSRSPPATVRRTVSVVPSMISAVTT